MYKKKVYIMLPNSKGNMTTLIYSDPVSTLVATYLIEDEFPPLIWLVTVGVTTTTWRLAVSTRLIYECGTKFAFYHFAK